MRQNHLHLPPNQYQIGAGIQTLQRRRQIAEIHFTHVVTPPCFFAALRRPFGRPPCATWRRRLHRAWGRRISPPPPHSLSAHLFGIRGIHKYPATEPHSRPLRLPTPLLAF